MNKLTRPKFVHVLLVITVALLAANLAASTDRATASIENVQIAQIDKQATQQPESETDAPLGNGFTYQGRLKDGPNPANGQYDLQFKLFDSISGGTQVGPTITRNNQAVNEGLVTASLDFGIGRFQGQERYLEVAVRPAGGGAFTTLVPRQSISAAPYSQFSQDVQPYDNVVVVAKSGGDVATISTAIIIITDASPTNRYLVKVGPGVYTDTITMKQYVDIEGSGEGTTRITSDGGPTPLTGSTVQGADNAELRSLTVENTGGDAYAIAIHNNDDSPSLLNVTANVSGGTADNYGVYNINSSWPSMKYVSVTVTGGSVPGNYGVYNENNSAPMMSDVIATASGSSSYGVYNLNSSPTMTNVTASGGSSGVHNSGSSPRMTDVTATASGQFISKAIENHDNSSPLMTGVTAIVSGATGSNTGVDNRDSSPTMTDMTINISSSGDSAAYGVSNHDSNVTMTNLRINVTRENGESNGVISNDSTVTIYGSRITLTEGALTNDSGIRNFETNLTVQSSVISLPFVDPNDRAIRNIASSGNYIVRIDNSTLQAAVIIGNDAEFDTSMGASKLDFFADAITGSGTVTCAGVYDENYTFFANTCP